MSDHSFIIPKDTPNKIEALFNHEVSANPLPVLEPDHLFERILNAALSCFSFSDPAETSDHKTIHATLLKADTTVSHINLYVRLQSFFRPLLKLVNKAPSIDSLTKQLDVLRNEKKTADAIQVQLDQSAHEPSAAKLINANNRLKKSLENAIKETCKALEQAHKDESDRISNVLSDLQVVLGPHHLLPTTTEAALKEALKNDAFFKEFKTVLGDAKKHQQAIEAWLQTDGSQPLITDFELRIGSLMMSLPFVNESQHKQLFNLSNILMQKLIPQNSQSVTDSMFLALFDIKELRQKGGVPPTISRELINLREQAGKRNRGELDAVESYFSDHKYLLQPSFNSWSTTDWEVIRTDAGSTGKALTSIYWKGQLAIPAGNQAIRRLAGTASLELRDLGPLSLEEEKSVLVFTTQWANLSDEKREKWKLALEKKDPSRILNLSLSPGNLDLRNLLVHDEHYWQVVDGKTTLLTQEEKEAFASKNETVLDRYQKLVQATSTFVNTMEKELFKMRRNIGKDDTPVIDIGSSS